MAWTSPLNWLTSQLVTAAQMNTYISDNLNFLKDRIGEMAIISDDSDSAINLSGSTWTTRTLSDVSSWDSQSVGTSISWLSLSSNIMTLSTGVYLVEAMANFASDSRGYAARIYDNDNTAMVGQSMVYTGGTITDGTNAQQVPAHIMPFILNVTAETDYVLQTYAVDYGNNYFATLAGSPYTYVRIQKIG